MRSCVNALEKHRIKKGLRREPGHTQQPHCTTVEPQRLVTNAPLCAYLIIVAADTASMAIAIADTAAVVTVVSTELPIVMVSILGIRVVNSKTPDTQCLYRRQYPDPVCQ